MEITAFASLTIAVLRKAIASTRRILKLTQSCRNVYKMFFWDMM